MRTIYKLLLVAGIILLLATESEYGQSNILGLCLCTLSLYKLDILKEIEL